MIKILNDDTIQKIAAGEVVERPSSVVKELVENSIDAKSDEITVEIKNGGKTYIKVSDNGTGINKDDIEIAFKRHATSKIDNFDDLYNIFSLGFRGEALASIVSVSKVILKSKTANDKSGVLVEYDNNELIKKANIGMNTGTIVEVYDLFNYVPVRKKFLGSDLTESNKITQLMYVFAIGNPHISITYIRDNREVFKTNNKLNVENNLSILFGDDFIKNSINISGKNELFKIHGVISNVNHYKGNRSMQYIYVNGRYIENEQITNAIESCYTNLIPTGRFPIFSINIDVNPQDIDINIHPNKQKIKFTFNDDLMEFIKNIITLEIQNYEGAKKVDLNYKEKPVINFYELNKGNGYQKILDSYKEPIDLSNFYNINHEETINYNTELNNVYDEPQFDSILEFNQGIEGEYFETSKEVEDNSSFNLKNYNYKSVIFNKFIQLEHVNSDNLVFININRANQKVIYENVINNQEIISQIFMEPEIINLNRKDMEKLSNKIDIFKNLGFDIDLFSEDSVILRSSPYYLDKPTSIDNFKFLLDDISNSIDNETKKYILKKSISLANNKKIINNDVEAIKFLEQLLETKPPYKSPSGKDIIFEIDYKNFNRMIKND